MTSKLVHFGLDDSTFWVIAAVMQLVSNHYLVQKEMEIMTTTGIIASVFWILATLRLIQKQPSQSKIVSGGLLIGSILFLVSYLIKPAGPDNLDKLMQDLQTIWGVTIAGGLSFALAAGITFKNTFRNKDVPQLVPYGAMCFVLGALLTVASMIANFASNSVPALAYASAVLLVIGALLWKVNNIKTPLPITTRPRRNSTEEIQPLSGGMRRRR